MPHAVDPGDLQLQQDEAAIARLLNPPAEDAEDGLDLFNRDLDPGEKADDAEDFEDIGDDDLASESAGDALDALEEDQDADFDGDLFGEDTASPPAEGADDLDGAAQPAPRPQLALPSKIRIALPGFLGQNGASFHGPVHDSPASYHPSDALGTHTELPTTSATPEPEPQPETDDEEDNQEWNTQKTLFAAANREREERARRGSSYEPPPAPATLMDVFYSNWPTYDPDRPPRFTELFPPRRGFYGWKKPLKPPKHVQTTKLTLELQPDTERSFRALPGATTAKTAREAESEHRGIIFATRAHKDEQQSEENVDVDEIDEDEEIGGVSWRDITVLCEDWDLPSMSSLDNTPQNASQQADSGNGKEEAGWQHREEGRPAKRRRVDGFDIRQAAAIPLEYPSLEDPVRATAHLAKGVLIDMNDPGLLIDENAPNVHPRKSRRVMGSTRHEAKDAMSRRYNVSNDEAYELLKENHQHKIRSTLGSMAIDHSLPAQKLQYPFYRVKLEPRQLRSFHRPHFTGERPGREIKFAKPKLVKKKHLRGRETHDIFAKAEDLSMGDNSSGLLLEYSEESPLMLSNFGMGNRLINYYRRKDENDQSRPKEEIGETQVLLPQDRSPFANFGQVDAGELVPSIHNGLYRAPVFKHEGKSTDFVVVSSSTSEFGRRYYLRNVENLHAVGQQFPSTEVPGEHSRKVTDAAKRRLRAISYRVYKKSLERKGPPLNNAIVQAHLPGSDVAQNRGKMREFMMYDKYNQVWVPKTGNVVPDSETLRGWIKPEDICVLDSMQVGVQHLSDLGLHKEDDNDDDDVKEGANIELQLAPWNISKNFLNACQGKAMLQLHGEGEPTGRGEGFSFIKTSMKGGFRALGESIEERLDAKRLKENGGHSYNVARQQRAYDESIRRVWRAQQESLSSNLEHSATEEADADDEPESASGRKGTPRSSYATPAAYARHDDESASQFSRFSASQNNKTLIITRTRRDKYGNMEHEPVTVTNPRVIAAYRRKKLLEKSQTVDVMSAHLTGDSEFDDIQRRKIEEELARLQRNMERREARERAKGILGSPSAAASPVADADDGDATAPSSGKKPRGKKNTEGTGRRCANCGQVGHIKTNKKLCPMLNGTMKPEDAHTGFGSGNVDGGTGGAFGAVPTPLAL